MDTPLSQTGEVCLTRPPDPPGQLRTLITVIDGQVIMDFGRAIWWVGYTTDQAEKLANDLLTAVRTARTLHLPGD